MDLTPHHRQPRARSQRFNRVVRRCLVHEAVDLMRLCVERVEVGEHHHLVPVARALHHRED
jgi:hypothetical protein